MLRALAGALALGTLAAFTPTAIGAEQVRQTTYTNPILGGFHADPSVCRVGSDYYLVTSSFEYFPGVPVYHSKDLVNWRQIGHALTRTSQLDLKGQKSSKGIFAPSIRCHQGTFYMITTNIENGGSFYVHTKDPAGPWSEPVWIKESSFGMDPSLLFDDDGKVYYTRHGGGEKGGVYQAEIDIKTGVLKEEARLIWPGTGGVWPEGPHLYKKDGMYYLMISEGGTSYNHSITMARSRSPWGPFEVDPANPILTHRAHPALALQATGHGDLVQGENGSWWMVLLGIRPLDKVHHIGRETLLAPVAWNDQGWLTVNNGKPIFERMTVPNLPPAAPWPKTPVRDDFAKTRLGLDWTMLRAPGSELYSLTERPGYLRLKGSAVSLDDVATPAFIGRRQEHLHARAATEVAFTPTAPGHVAGLAVRSDEANHVQLRITGAPQKRVELVTRVSGVSTVQKAAPIGPGPVSLLVTAFQDRYEFSYSVGGKALQAIGSVPTKHLSAEKTGSFTGNLIGMFSSGAVAKSGAEAGAGPMPAADFAWFDYQPLQSGAK